MAMARTSVLCLHCFLAAMLMSMSSGGEGTPLPSKPFPSLFIFGDSLVDVGNNNYIFTLARANTKPFGIDFPQGPTGRFTNGKTILDIVAELLGLPHLPPYLAPSTKGAAILNGVNYASGAGGILKRSGFNYINSADFNTQLEWFSNTTEELKTMLGVKGGKKRIRDSIYAVVLGSNDYINNYLLKISISSKQYTPQTFRRILIAKFKTQLTHLYELGARNVVVGSLGPLGCIPSQKVRQGSVNGECSAYVNKMAQKYNADLQLLLNHLNDNLPGAKFIYADTFNPVLDFHNNPTKYGFKYGSEACCGLGKYKAEGSCMPFLTPCKNRDDYVFFDAHHPSQKSNILLANQLYEKLAKYVFPA